VLTCEPNSMMATIHNRMPAILSPADYMTWLMHRDPEHLMAPFPEELMTMWKIGRDVGNPRNNRPDLLDPVKDDLFDP
jgi:putative SOS response-associated peptidase YedK